MAKKDRYTVAKSLIENGSVKTIRDLLTVIDKTPLAKDVRVSAVRFNKLIANPALFMFQDAINIAEVLGVDPKLIIDLIYADIAKGKRKKK